MANICFILEFHEIIYDPTSNFVCKMILEWVNICQIRFEEVLIQIEIK